MNADEVKQARKVLKCTTKELAAALGVEASLVSAWELGEQFPTKSSVDALRALLAGGPASVPRKAKGADPVEALHDPDVWALVRKILVHPKLRAEVAKIADKYDDV